MLTTRYSKCFSLCAVAVVVARSVASKLSYRTRYDYPSAGIILWSVVSGLYHGCDVAKKIFVVQMKWHWLFFFLLMVLSVLKATLRLEFLNNLVINFVCRPTYVNLDHLVFIFVFTSFCVCASIVRAILFIYLFLFFSCYRWRSGSRIDVPRRRDCKRPRSRS